MSRRRNKRTTANPLEQKMGVQGTVSAQVSDMFTNAAARQGFGTPSLGQGANYELVRLSYDYWQLITLYRNHWISRRIVEVPAQDMVKAWPKLTSEVEPKDLDRIDRVLRKTNTKNNVLTALTWARLFGGSGGLMVIDGQENELDQPLDLDSIKIGGYKGIIPFDRWAGISPLGDVCTDINRPLDFNKPEMYEVRITGGDSFRVHSSRLLRFLGPSVPTPELEAQSYWGISVLEPTYESITMLDNTMWNILGLTFRANLLGMKFPDLAQLLSGVGSSQVATQKFEQRMGALNHMVSNQSLIPLPADGGIESTQYSFGGLEGIFQLFQLNLAGAAQMPVTRLFGRTYTGLGQTGDGDERIYEEKISTDQSTYLVPQLEKLYPVLCMSELGEVPDDLDLSCPSIRVLTEQEKSDLAKSTADTLTVYLNGGIMSPRVVGREVKQSSDITGIGTNLDNAAIEKLSDDVQSEGEMGDLFGEGEPGLNPSDDPTKVAKEENKTGEKEDQDEPKKEALSKAGEAKDTAPAMDALPAGLSEGEKVLVGGKLLTVKKVTTGTEDLFGEETVQVMFTTGEIVAYRPDQDVKTAQPRGWDARHGTRTLRRKAEDEDGASSITKSAQEMIDYHALPVRIENLAGAPRGGVTPSGESWHINMAADYGFIEGVVGADGDSLDCYIGSSPESGNVFIIDQKVLDGEGFDEHKVFLGYHTKDAVLDDYASCHHRADEVYGGITEFTMPAFRKWMRLHDMTKPCAERLV
jgi:phage-related protein (TIGR01555 family)